MPSLEWKHVDGDRLGSAQRQGVDLCHAIIEASTKGDRAKTMDMLDVLSAIVIYEIFGRQSDYATSQHANNVMGITDIIDERLTAVGRNRP